jgi:hypothetical protein
MSDLRERFKVLDALQAPDLRDEILARPMRPAPAPSSRQRVVAGAVAGLVALLGVGAGGWALLRLRGASEPGRRPSPRVSPSVHEVFDFDTYPGGSEAFPARGLLLARAEGSDRVWTLSVTRGRGEDGICLHLNSGVGCGRPGAVFTTSEEKAEGPGVRFVYGAVTKDAAEVVVSFNDGTDVRAEPIEGPPGFGVDFYVVGIRGTARLVSVQALDRRGKVLESLGHGTLAPALPGPTARDRRIARALIRFARSPSNETLSDLPLDPGGVWLGLGDRLFVKWSAQQLADPGAWGLEVDRFRAYAGPFSALERLAPRQRTTVSVGPHPHCASPPMLPPSRVADLRRVSIQPRSWNSCLQWWTVDLFLTGDGEIAAVTLDLWEP